MTSEEKQLLLIDLSGRLFYGVKGLHRGEVHELFTIDSREVNNACIQVDGYDAWFSVDTFKPYLRPLSSMTVEEKEVLERLSNCFVQTRVLERDRDGKIKKQISYLDNEIREIDLFGDSDGQYLHINQQNFIDTSDFFNSRHFDHRGLISMGLALEAPEDMYKTE